MVGVGNKKEDQLVINSTNVFAALGTLRKKKKKSDKDTKGRSSSKKETEQPKVFWAPAPLIAKSWADVEDESEDDYYATTAPPQVAWGAAEAAEEQQTKGKESAPPLVLQDCESEDEGLDEVDEDIEQDHEHEVPTEGEPIVKAPVVVLAPKESQRQLSKKELKKKELEELEAMLAEFGCNQPEEMDGASGITHDKIAGNENGGIDGKDNGGGGNGDGESKNAKKKKKKPKEAKEQQNGVEVVEDKSVAAVEEAEDGVSVDVKEKIKKVQSMRKKKSSKEMDAAAKAAASEAAARRAKVAAAAKKKDKNHYNQQPLR